MTKDQAYASGFHFGFESFPYPCEILATPEELNTGATAAEFAIGFTRGFDYAKCTDKPYEQGVSDLTFVWNGPVDFFNGGAPF